MAISRGSTLLCSFIEGKDGETQETFARRVRVAQSTVSRLMRGVQTPDIALATRIEIATEGAVPIMSWTEPPRRRKAA